jgi:SAM-dependent methyltransferase
MPIIENFQMLNQQIIDNWYKKLPGSMLMHTEINSLKNELPHFFGFFLLQMGGASYENYLAQCLVHNQIYLTTDLAATLQKPNKIQAKFDELPFLANSIDVIVMLHILELQPNPELVLYDAYNALIPGGNLVIFGFNPLSLWGVAKTLKIFYNNNEPFPWKSNFISAGKMRHMLTEIGFSVGDYKTFCFRPPCKNKAFLRKMLFIENLGQIFWPYCGANYMFIAKKNITPLTPISNKTWTKKLPLVERYIKHMTRNKTNKNYARIIKN